MRLAKRTPSAGRFAGGVRIGLSLAVPIFGLGVTFGALARSDHWGIAAPLASSILVFSSSAQFTLLTSLSSGGAIVTAVLAAGLINARFLSMAVAVAPALHGGRRRRALEAQAVVDGSWVFAHLGGGRFDRDRLIGATLPQYPAWILGTAVGLVLAPSAQLTQASGLDVVFPAFFLTLLIDEARRSHMTAVVAVGSAMIAGGLLLLTSPGAALLGASSIALLGLRSPVSGHP